MKLVSLNMEHDKHFERVVPFLQREEPDVVCLQEVLEGDLSRLGVALGAQWHFAPMTRFTHEGHPRHGEVQGVAVFSRVPVLGHEVRYYFGGEGSVPDHFAKTSATLCGRRLSWSRWSFPANGYASAPRTS